MRATAIRSPAPAGRSPAPEPQATPKQAGILNRRPQAVAQRKLAEFIHRSPRVVAQAKREADLLALPAQRTAAPGNQPTHRIPHGPEEDETLQLKTDAGATAPVPAQLKSNPNRTGMPDRLKAGIESLSGVDMSDVRVHANSDKPAQLNALAYAQGSDIHLGPGQERHLPHEAWHVVQQKQGRVQPTIHVKGVAINAAPHLEAEANRIGFKAMQQEGERIGLEASKPSGGGPLPAQFIVLQRITFERSNTGAIGGLLGRVDSAAKRWTLEFNILDHLVMKELAPKESILTSFRDFKAEFQPLKLFVNTHRAQNVVNASRNTVGAQIERNLGIAHRIALRKQDYMVMGNAKCKVLGALNAQQFEFYNAVGCKILSLLTEQNLKDFFALPLVALTDFVTIDAARQKAIALKIANMIHVASLDRAFNDYNGNLKQGHTFSEHGAHRSDAYMMSRADANHTPKGRWLNFDMQSRAIKQAQIYMWDPATYAATPNDSALTLNGNNHVNPGGVINAANLQALKRTPNTPRTKRKVDLLRRPFGAATGTSFFPVPSANLWNLWNPTRPPPQVASFYTAIFTLEPGVAFRVLTAYPVV